MSEIEAVFQSKQNEYYQAFVGRQDLSLDSILGQMTNMYQSEMTREEYQEFVPLADELMVYFSDLTCTPEGRD